MNAQVGQTCNIQQAANLAQVSLRTIYNWMDAGKIDYILFEGRRRVITASLFITNENRRHVMNWQLLVSQIALIALGLNPLTAPLAPILVPAIVATEDLFKHKPKPTTPEEKKAQNAAKLANAVVIAHAGINTANQLHPGTIDPAVSDALITDSINTVVDAASLIHKSPLASRPVIASPLAQKS